MVIESSKITKDMLQNTERGKKKYRRNKTGSSLSHRDEHRAHYIILFTFEYV
jgi:hypothetical protein